MTWWEPRGSERLVATFAEGRQMCATHEGLSESFSGAAHHSNVGWFYTRPWLRLSNS